MTGDSELAKEWEKFCKEDYMEWKKTNPPPFIANFPWSGGAFFDAHERWSDDHRKHYMRTGEAWWNERGFTVTSWPRSNLPITVAPIERKKDMTGKIEIGMAIMDGDKVIGVATFDSDERLSKMMADSAKRGLTVKTMNVEEAKRQMAENYANSNNQ